MYMEFLAYLGKFLFFTLLAEYARPAIQRQKPSAGSMKDLNLPTADASRPHQWVMGRVVVDNPNLLATHDFKTTERTKRIRTGMVRRETIVVGNDYAITPTMILCGGTGVRLREVWLGDDHLVWSGNVGNGSAISINAEWIPEGGQADMPAGLRGTLEFYSGSNTPSPYLVAKRGAGNVPAWPHLTYVVLRGPDLNSGAWVGTSPQIANLKLVVERMPSASSTGVGAHPDGGDYHVVDGDANVAYCIAEVMTNQDYGAGIDTDFIIPESFHATAKTLYLENHGTSQAWDGQRPTGEVVLELCRQIGGVLQPDPTTGSQTLRLLRSTDPVVIHLDDSNIERLDSYAQNTIDEATNALTLLYRDRTAQYKQAPIDVQDLAAIETAGQVIPGTVNYAGVTNATLGNILALRDLRTMSSPLATARVQVSVPKKIRFMPGDLVQLASVKHGIVAIKMRVTTARYAKPGESVCEMELIEDVFKAGESVYKAPVTTSPTANQMAPGQVGWQSYIQLAPWPLTEDPTQPLMLYFAGAPGLNPERATRYRLGFFDDETVRNSSTAAWSEKEHGFAARGELVSDLGLLTTGGTSLNVSVADGYTISKNAGVEVLAMDPISYEFMRVIASPISPTLAQLTILERGVHGTLPVTRTAGQTLVLLYDYIVDPAPLQMNASGVVQVDSFVRPQTIGPGGLGPFDTLSQGSDLKVSAGQNWSVNSLKPYAPGAVKINGTHGLPCDLFGELGTVAKHASLPTITGALALAFTGRNRTNKTGYEGYLAGTGFEKDALIQVDASYREVSKGGTYPGGGYFEEIPGVVSTGGGYTIPTTSLPTGALVLMVRIRVTSPTAGYRAFNFAWTRPA